LTTTLPPHPWTRSFQLGDTRGPLRHVTVEQAAKFDERLMIAESGAITFTTHLVAQSQIARTFATHDVFVDLCADLLGPGVDMYWDNAKFSKSS
jgi:hypothetical protein